MKQRIVALFIYCGILLAVQYFLVEPKLPPGTIKGLWFYNGIASLLLGSRLLNPYFTPPGDAATNAFVSLITLIAASAAFPDGSPDIPLLVVAGIFCALVFGA